MLRIKTPAISVVIPTRNRPVQLLRAISSVQRQTVEDLEIIVIIDGPDDVTLSELKRAQNDRLRVVPLSESHGGASARNAGIAHARGEWVAFLDDDDEWLPTKLEIQLRYARHSPFAQPVVGCRMLVKTPSGEFVLPRRLPFPGEHISEYMMVRRSAFHGEGLLQTSMLLMKRELLQQVSFTDGLRRHHETDLMLRAFAVEGVGLVMAEETLGIWYKDDARPSVSKTGDWSYSFEWARKMRQYMTPKAYSSFLFTGVSALAAHESGWTALPKIVAEARRCGAPSPIDYFILAGMFLIPQHIRQAVRSTLLARRR